MKILINILITGCLMTPRYVAADNYHKTHQTPNIEVDILELNCMYDEFGSNNGDQFILWKRIYEDIQPIGYTMIEWRKIDKDKQWIARGNGDMYRVELNPPFTIKPGPSSIVLTFKHNGESIPIRIHYKHYRECHTQYDHELVVRNELAAKGQEVIPFLMWQYIFKEQKPTYYEEPFKGDIFP